MSDTVNQQEINQIVWRACDTFRGTVDPPVCFDLTSRRKGHQEAEAAFHETRIPTEEHGSIETM